VWFKILKRSLLLFFIGLFFNLWAINFGSFTRVRVPGVLQRISLCYLVVSVMLLCLPIVLQWLFIAAYMISYLLLIYLVDVPNCGKGILTDECNSAGYIDRSIFGDNMIQPTDSEGLVSSLTAVITCYLGNRLVIGGYLRHQSLTSVRYAGFEYGRVLSQAKINSSNNNNMRLISRYVYENSALKCKSGFIFFQMGLLQYGSSGFKLYCRDMDAIQ